MPALRFMEDGVHDYQDHNEDIEQVEETEVHHFCKLTFGQFFTLMVLEIITLCFVFYLGARYGNQYLKLDVISETRREPISIVAEGTRTPDDAKEEAGLAGMSDDELRAMARKALNTDKPDLRKRVEEILARQEGPTTTPPVGEPSFNAEESQESFRPADGQPEESAPQDLRAYNPDASEQPDSAQGVVKVKSTAGAKFAVQVGSYPDVKEASYRVEEWKIKGYPAYMMIANLGDKGQWYRVRIGAFSDKDEADSYLKGLVDKEEITDAFVVQNEQ